MSKILHIALNTYRETVRDKILYNLVFFALLLIACSYALARLAIGQEVKMVKDLGLAAIAIFGAAMAIVIGVGLISKEIERRTLYTVLAKPVSRSQFLLGKYFGLCLTLAVNVAVMSLSLYVMLFVLSRGVDPALLKAIYLIGWQLALVTAVALFFSTFASSSALSSVLTAFVYVVGHFSADLKRVGEVMDSAWAAQVATVVYYALPNLANFDVKGAVVYGDPVPWTTLGLASLYGAVYIGAILLLAGVIFRRRDLQ
jgi:ABC-type transport system involved in multi-copper enzyme maturation permease subunit